MYCKIGKLLDNIPVLMDISYLNEVEDDGITPVVDSELLVVNPKSVDKNKRCTYVLTLLPFRDDMITTISQVTDFVGLNHYTDDSISHKGFEVKSIDDVKPFFMTKGGKLNPMVKEWLASPLFNEIQKKFFSEAKKRDDGDVFNQIIVQMKKGEKKSV